MERKKVDYRDVLKIGGAYMASIMGAGFATGQELLQFFSAQGAMSLVGVLVSTILLSLMGALFMKHGRVHNLETPRQTTEFYFGKKLGGAVEVVIEIFLYCIFFMMISGSGTILSQFFGFSLWSGRILMTTLIFLTTALGLKRFVEVLGLLGPILIALTLFTGTRGLLAASLTLREASALVPTLDTLKTEGGWFLSSVLYPTFNAVAVFYFLCSAGRTAKGEREAYWGGILGGVFLGLSILVMDGAFLLNYPLVYNEEIPSIALATLSGPGFAVFFSVLICVCIYGVGMPSLWSVSRRFGEDGSPRAILASFVLSVLALFLSLTDFRTLVNLLYPISGYAGFLLFFLLVYREIQDRRR